MGEDEVSEEIMKDDLVEMRMEMGKSHCMAFEMALKSDHCKILRRH